MIRIGTIHAWTFVTPAHESEPGRRIPPRQSWKRDLAPYLEPDDPRSRGQIAGVVLPYVGIWVLAALIRPGPWAAAGLGLAATVFLVRMYSLLAALQGSSYLKLPRPLAWVVGNANYHHVHHLSARIPNYRLRSAHEEQPLLARTPVVTIASGLRSLRLKLWDEECRSLVGYPPRGSLPLRVIRRPHPGRT